MKILIPVDENKKDVCVSFARAPYFMVYSDENDQAELVENAAASAQGGAGLVAAQFVVDQGADVLITVRCGENAAKVLQAAEVEIMKSTVEDAMENIRLLKENKLAKLTHFHAGFHGIR